jgi:glycosyltransferase involved in cell wall biosynthesis
MMQNQKLNIALVTNMVAPYRVSFYDELSSHCELTVVTDATSEFNRNWKLDQSQFKFTLLVLNSLSIVLPRKRKDLGYQEHRQLHFAEKLIPTLWGIRPDVVVSNELGLRSFWCMLYCKIMSCPWILASEATNHTEGWVGGVKKLFRKLLISQADYFWSNGKETNTFLIDRGASISRIMPSMTGIATQKFKQDAAKAFTERDVLRNSLGLRGVVFLYVGRLETGKGLKQLMEAIQLKQAELDGKCSFLFVGSGAMSAELDFEAAKLPQITFHFQGFVQPDKLPLFFSVGDVFVMPTLDDNWPLVNLEALAAGLPHLYSIYNGGMMDMNSIAGLGNAIDPHDVSTLAERLVECVIAPPDRIIGQAADHLLAHYCPSAQAERAVESFRTVCSLQNE